MSALADTQRRSRTMLWLLAAGAIAVVIAANVHLVYVAIASQPECVAHARQGEGAGRQFSAAQSSCSPASAPSRLQGDRP
jgi:hypothetical protein